MNASQMSSVSSNKAFAIVARGPVSAGLWDLEPVVYRAIKDDEVLVRIVASGICLADVHFGDVLVEPGVDNLTIWYPRVLGHEGGSLLTNTYRIWYW
jgi:D-arabinose 1-dehydrogenase-like Zn-dependent alcohol dehydrogenase